MPKHRFEKGNNYGKGRPKGSRNKSVLMRERNEVVLRLLNEVSEIKHPISGEIKKLTQEEIIMLAQIGKARKGDTQAAKFLMQMLYDPLPPSENNEDKQQVVFNINWTPPQQ